MYWYCKFLWNLFIFDSEEENWTQKNSPVPICPLWNHLHLNLRKHGKNLVSTYFKLCNSLHSLSLLIILLYKLQKNIHCAHFLFNITLYVNTTFHHHDHYWHHQHHQNTSFFSVKQFSCNVPMICAFRNYLICQNTQMMFYIHGRSQQRIATLKQTTTPKHKYKYVIWRWKFHTTEQYT